MENSFFLNSKFDGSPNYEVIVLGEKLNNLNKKLNVLDLGCGDGRNSFYLSGLNCKIDAVDLDEQNLNRLDFFSKLYKRDIKIHKQDVRSFQFKKQYDIILSHGLLHFLNLDDTEKLMSNIVKHTKEGGVNMFTTAYYREGDSIPVNFVKGGHKNAYTTEKLKLFYEGWKIILDEDYYKWDFHHSFGSHGHRIQKLITQQFNSEIIFESFKYINKEITIPNKDNLIIYLNTSKDNLLKTFNIQYSIRNFISGPQMCFGYFAKNGFLMEWDFSQNILFQSNNNIISGITELKKDFIMIK